MTAKWCSPVEKVPRFFRFRNKFKLRVSVVALQGILLQVIADPPWSLIVAAQGFQRNCIEF